MVVVVVFRLWCAVPSCLYCLRLILLHSETGIGGWSSALSAAAALWEHFLTACCVSVCVWREAAHLEDRRAPAWSQRPRVPYQTTCDNPNNTVVLSPSEHIPCAHFFNTLLLVSKIMDAEMYVKESLVSKGALCCFKDDIFIRKARSSLADYFIFSMPW